MYFEATFRKIQLDIVQRDVNIVLPNPISDSFHATSNHVFKDSIKVKIFLVLKRNPIYVHPPDNTTNMKAGHDALQKSISSSLINLCYIDFT